MITLSLRAWAAMLVAVTGLGTANVLVLAFVLADAWDKTGDKDRDKLG